MTISTVLIWFLIATAIVVAIPSMWMVCYALAPTRTQDYRDTASCGVIPNLLIGLIPAVVTFFGVAAILQARKGPAVGLVLAVGGLVLMWSLMGAGGIALLVGDRLWPGRNQFLRDKNRSLLGKNGFLPGRQELNPFWQESIPA